MQTFRTADTSLAAAILHGKFPLITIDRTSPKIEFLFEDSPQLQEMVARYWRDELMCPAQSLLISFRRAKHLLHDFQG